MWGPYSLPVHRAAGITRDPLPVTVSMNDAESDVGKNRISKLT